MTDGLIMDGPEKVLYDDGEFGDEHIILLPGRVFAFVLRNRKFGKFCCISAELGPFIADAVVSHEWWALKLTQALAILPVEGLTPIKPYVHGFQDLNMPDGHKAMVKSLGYNHFAGKDADMYDLEKDYGTDLVRGKGKGLIVLLHGAPGVGKTSTAECVAAASGKLLFPITCGDLGLTAEEVETELSEKFHLAEVWNCVLLLDEIDVFLAQRTRTDIARNSLVSVFLRMLGYFTGILFLTSNRVGAFDEAF